MKYNNGVFSIKTLWKLNCLYLSIVIAINMLSSLQSTFTLNDNKTNKERMVPPFLVAWHCGTNA